MRYGGGHVVGVGGCQCFEASGPPGQKLDRMAHLEGAGVYYAATQHEAEGCAGREVAVIGGGNSRARRRSSYPGTRRAYTSMPYNGCLVGRVACDNHGFILTGSDIPMPGTPAPLPLETSLPGVFCVGDVRSRSVKRVATAIGEGAMAVRLVFDRLEASARARRHVPAVD